MCVERLQLRSSRLQWNPASSKAGAYSATMTLQLQHNRQTDVGIRRRPATPDLSRQKLWQTLSRPRELYMRH